MSEQGKPKNYMQELDSWIDAHVIEPLLRPAPAEADVDRDPTEHARLEVKKAIRGKVLESYHNGQAAGPRKAAITGAPRS